MIVHHGGFPRPEQTAPLHSRYVGLYHYNDYWRTWDKILGIEGRFWVVQEVNSEVIRKHITPLWADRFADQPFKV